MTKTHDEVAKDIARAVEVERKTPSQLDPNPPLGAGDDKSRIEALERKVTALAGQVADMRRNAVAEANGGSALSNRLARYDAWFDQLRASRFIRDRRKPVSQPGTGPRVAPLPNVGQDQAMAARFGRPDLNPAYRGGAPVVVVENEDVLGRDSATRITGGDF